MSALPPALPSLDELVNALPEIYQPIYGHPEYDSRAARAEDGRLTQIIAVHDALAKQLGRPLRVLDLGCAQGWFCFNLAKAGAEVIGVDILAANINVCNMLALENRELKARFALAEIERIGEFLNGRAFDLVLGLSVLHHICFHNGIDAARGLTRVLFKKIPNGIFEFALAGEPMVWAAAQPQDPRTLIDHVPFHRILSENATHLSPVKRPLYFCSRAFWLFGAEAEPFENARVDGRGRRYFFNASKVAKLYDVTGEEGPNNRAAIRRAAQFLAYPPQGFPEPPKLVQSGEDDFQAWLVQARIDGDQLDALIATGKPYDAQKVLIDVLRALSALERAGLYHSDLRTWNVLIDRNGQSHLIDYNAITTATRDCVWPWDVFLAFFLFVREVVTGKNSYTNPVRQPFVSPTNLPEPYRRWGMACWARPVAEWRFAALLESLEAGGSEAAPPHPSAIAHWMQGTEQYLDATTEAFRNVEAPFWKLVEAVLTSNRAMDQRIKNLEAALAEMRERKTSS